MRLVKGDVPNAYRKAPSQRGRRRGLRMPEHLREYDSDGVEFVLVYANAMWGEETAGYEWDVFFGECRTEIGWTDCVGTPGLWAFGESMMIGEVDDFLIAEPFDGSFAIAARTIALLEQKVDDEIKVEAEPTAYAGWQLAR